MLNLEITGSEISDSDFSLVPATATIPPGTEQIFEVFLLPDTSFVGQKEATITFIHNGIGGRSSITARADVVTGRGDLTGDNIVDIADLIYLLDIVLGRIAPSADVVISADLHPFDAPDGSLDVRDLTVLAQAIVRGTWPDGSNVPEALGSTGLFSAAGKSTIMLKAGRQEDKISFFLEHEMPIRGLQIFVEYPLSETVVSEMLPALEGLVHFMEVQDHANMIRLIAYEANGEAIEAGNTPLFSVKPAHGAAEMHIRYGVALGVSGERYPIIIHPEALASENGTPEVADLQINNVYPNPMVRGKHTGWNVTAGKK